MIQVRYKFNLSEWSSRGSTTSCDPLVERRKYQLDGVDDECQRHSGGKTILAGISTCSVGGGEEEGKLIDQDVKTRRRCVR